MTVFQGPSRLSVVRELDNGTMLAELWVLTGNQWYEEMNEADIPITVTCYIGNINRLSNLNRVGPSDEDVVKDVIELQEAPEEVQAEFEQMAKRLQRRLGET